MCHPAQLGYHPTQPHKEGRAQGTRRPRRRRPRVPRRLRLLRLLVDGKAAGVIEAKKTGITLSGVTEQAAKYMTHPPAHLARWDDFLIYGYESTGEETFFHNLRDPKPRSRRLFAFHRPETLLDWLRQPSTLRARLRQLPPLETKGLRDAPRSTGKQVIGGL